MWWYGNAAVQPPETALDYLSLLALNCTWRKCCFAVCYLAEVGDYVPCFHFWGLCEGAKSEQSGMVGWVAWLELNCCGVTGCPLLHSPSSGYQNRSCIHSKPTDQLGPVFPMNLVSTSQPSWAGGKVVPLCQGGSGSIHWKHFSSLDHGDVIWENLWQCLKPCVVTKLSDASGDRRSLIALCTAQSLDIFRQFQNSGYTCPLWYK